MSHKKRKKKAWNIRPIVTYCVKISGQENTNPQERGKEEKKSPKISDEQSAYWVLDQTLWA